jgi:hypothetical protein
MMASAAYLIANDQSWRDTRQSPQDRSFGPEETLFGPLPR